VNTRRERRSLRVVAFILALTTLGGVAAAQAAPNEAQVKAAFVFNFLKFVEWPDSAFRTATDSLVVGIVGSGATAEATARLLAGKHVQGHAIAIRRLGDDGQRPEVHALFFGTQDIAGTQRIVDSLARTPVLSIGESAGFAQRGGVIELLVEAHKIRFEINAHAAALAGLRISSKLLALATVVLESKLEPGAPK